MGKQGWFTDKFGERDFKQRSKSKIKRRVNVSKDVLVGKLWGDGHGDNTWLRIGTGKSEWIEKDKNLKDSYIFVLYSKTTRNIYSYLCFTESILRAVY